METINNLAASASKAVWGESNTTAPTTSAQSGEEPISGQKGNTAKGEPFDKGNIEEPQTSTTTEPQTSTSAGPHTTTSGGTSQTKEGAPEFAKTTGTAAESSTVPDNKATNLKAKDTPADTTKGQNDVRDPEDPQTHPKNNPTDVDDTGDGPNKAQNVDAPGPKPLDEVAKIHGGDAGHSETVAGDDTTSKAKGKDEEDPNDPHAASKGEGTGEQYVKSTGVKADGGDFDATKPGAGREADRLLEEKGIHKDTAGPPGASDTSVDKGGEKEKKSIGTKIKEKLHRH
ncbi:hypothetical protein BJ170DRAFT_96712 [Xylariales sp. AK1849]|nr:hypothetical protein BJ170DRAFT_96712 [Xylariales sp. AK1849]